MSAQPVLIAISGAQVSSLSNDFGMERVIDNCVLPESPMHAYGWKLTPFGRAVLSFNPAFFAGCHWTGPKWHVFEPGRRDTYFCEKCGFPAEEHPNKGIV